MKKMLIVIKCEYLRRVKSRTFIILTLLGPLLFAGFTAVPAVLINLRTGQPQRVAIVDQTGLLYENVRDSLSKSSQSLKSESKELRGTDALTEKERYFLEQAPVSGR
ncbi:MAG: hypothetical protein ACRD63_13255, partial [Pyrinomonadaceae bacterium]